MDVLRKVGVDADVAVVLGAVHAGGVVEQGEGLLRLSFDGVVRFAIYSTNLSAQIPLTESRALLTKLDSSMTCIYRDSLLNPCAELVELSGG